MKRKLTPILGLAALAAFAVTATPASAEGSWSRSGGGAV